MSRSNPEGTSVRSVLILSATSAIAAAVAREFAAHGFNLILGGRNQEELGPLASDLSLRYGVQTRLLAFDALDPLAHSRLLESCLAEAGKALKGVVVCTGYLGDQAKGQTDWEEARRIIDTNFTGCVSALNIIGNHFERKGAGFICAISSVAGDRGRQSNYLYGSAKAGLTAYLQGLRNRLYHSKVKVITVKPGFVDTPMTYGRQGLFLVASPETVAKGIFQAIAKGKDVVYLPWFWRLIMLMVRCIPEAVFKRMRT